MTLFKGLHLSFATRLAPALMSIADLRFATCDLRQPLIGRNPCEVAINWPISVEYNR